MRFINDGEANTGQPASHSCNDEGLIGKVGQTFPINPSPLKPLPPPRRFYDPERYGDANKRTYHREVSIPSGQYFRSRNTVHTLIIVGRICRVFRVSYI